MFCSFFLSDFIYGDYTYCFYLYMYFDKFLCIFFNIVVIKIYLVMCVCGLVCLGKFLVWKVNVL